MNLQLRYGSLLVGEIEDAFWSEGTGYGVFRLASGVANDPALRRVREFIAFCEEWHSRLDAEPPPDAAEFDAFRDVWDSGTWNTVSPDGAVCPIGEPVILEDSVTWRPA